MRVKQNPRKVIHKLFTAEKGRTRIWIRPRDMKN
jgi:hypothetical protein